MCTFVCIRQIPAPHLWNDKHAFAVDSRIADAGLMVYDAWSQVPPTDAKREQNKKKEEPESCMVWLDLMLTSEEMCNCVLMVSGLVDAVRSEPVIDSYERMRPHEFIDECRPYTHQLFIPMPPPAPFPSLRCVGTCCTVQSIARKLWCSLKSLPVPKPMGVRCFVLTATASLLAAARRKNDERTNYGC